MIGGKLAGPRHLWRRMARRRALRHASLPGESVAGQVEVLVETNAHVRHQNSQARVLKLESSSQALSQRVALQVKSTAHLGHHDLQAMWAPEYDSY